MASDPPRRKQSLVLDEAVWLSEISQYMPNHQSHNDEELQNDNQEEQYQAQNKAMTPWPAILLEENNPEYLMKQYGSLKYPCICPNHHLAINRHSKWIRNYKKRKRGVLNRLVNKRWGERSMILKDPAGLVIIYAFTLGTDVDLIRNHISPKLDENEDKANVELVGWAREVRVVHPPSCDRLLMKRLIACCGTHYNAKVTRGPNGEAHVLIYWCACECWEASIARHNVVDWSLTNPVGNWDFEAYLKSPSMKMALAMIQDDPEY